MISFQNILFEQGDGVARITLNRPDKLNSFTVDMHKEVAQAIDQMLSPDTRVLVITGSGRGFCAGQDLGDRAVTPGGQRPDLGESIERYYAPLIRRLRALQRPVIAAVNGIAAGAGCSIALACDIVIATRSADFLLPFSKIGLVPDAGASWFLPRLVGPARATGMAMLGEKISATQAQEWGLIWRCVDDESFVSEVDALARRLAQAPTLALARTKQSLQASWGNGLEEQLQMERDHQRELGRSDDYAEGVAAFLAKRAPKFTGR
jgi:2-(1,2-epoxy-1,2-dihydrophenyl)acetyl-CoA isomerase